MTAKQWLQTRLKVYALPSASCQVHGLRKLPPVCGWVKWHVTDMHIWIHCYGPGFASFMNFVCLTLLITQYVTVCLNQNCTREQLLVHTFKPSLSYDIKVLSLL